MAKQHLVEVVMSKEERGRGARRAVELYQEMNLEPMPREAVKEEYRKWERKRWRKEKEVERRQREKKEKERKEAEEDWRVIDRKRVYDFLQRQKEEKHERRRSEFIKVIMSEYNDVAFN